MRLIYRVVLGGFAVLALAFLIDLILLFFSDLASVTFPNKGTASTCEIVITQVDRVRKVVRTDITVTVRSPTLTFRNLAFAVRSTGAHYFIAEPTRGGGFDEEKEQAFNYASHQEKNVELPIEAASPELLYPFDWVRVPFELHACANLPPSETCSGKNAELRVVPSLTITPGDTVPNRYVLQKNPERRVVLRRQNFVILLTFYFIIVASAFLVFLRRIEGEEKLAANALGTLAALWGFRDLLVPESVDAFPTFIDYFVLLAFSWVLVIVIRRFSRRGISVAKS